MTRVQDTGAEETATAIDLKARPIVLVGLMGAGKSSIGRRLANQLGLPFKDADAEIEAASNLTVSEFFDLHGEAAFREGERKVIARLLKEPRHVLATGGGAFMDKKTRSLIKKKGCSIWLRAELDVIYKRCMKRNNRPLLKTGNPKNTLKMLMEERYPIYADADITVDSGDGPHEIVVDKIITALAALEGPPSPLDEATNK
ncbi:shikimate kinase [uncultured Sneathiella sp.]|jgi:shikimate kinase|uniref:shikimate kinase n=1 Tax=uncultured Sneathiella sp. TaxID=879315 RepID=UPI0030D8C3E9|tara:strand:- start:2150 stop:2752 length:603 start_codon:yes stop_codon:yes gene_type:complete